MVAVGLRVERPVGLAAASKFVRGGGRDVLDALADVLDALEAAVPRRRPLMATAHPASAAISRNRFCQSLPSEPLL